MTDKDWVGAQVGQRFLDFRLLFMWWESRGYIRSGWVYLLAGSMFKAAEAVCYSTLDGAEVSLHRHMEGKHKGSNKDRICDTFYFPLCNSRHLCNIHPCLLRLGSPRIVSDRIVLRHRLQPKLQIDDDDDVSRMKRHRQRIVAKIGRSWFG